jgi:hypothetical protein
MKAITTLLVAPFLLCMAGLADAAGPGAATAPVKGEVLEVREVDAYTYLRLKTADGETWAAVNKAAVKKGAQVTIANPTVMHNFESKTLQKRFDTIVFGSLADANAPAAAAVTASPHGATAAAKPGGAPSTAPAPVKVSKATGADARTVAEVYAQKGTLKEKAVTIRGKVVKFNPGIMGKNWVHLQDGSGKADKGDNDITVTTQDMTSVGDTVLAKGTVRIDKDFGAGYAYPVIVEDAKLSK